MKKLILKSLLKQGYSKQNIRGAYLSGAYLRDANLSGAKTSYLTTNIHLACPEIGEFIGFKKADGKIITLKIHFDSLRSSATTSKCRCSKATVLEIEGGLPVSSDYDDSFVYEVGKVMEVSDLDTDRWNECSSGIHFFLFW